MKMNTKTTLLFSFLLATPTIYGNTVLRLGYAYNDVSSDAFSNYKTDVTGSSFHVSMADRVSILEYGLAYTSGSYKGTLKHDNSDQEFKGTYSRVSLDSKVFFNKHVFVQLGYGLTSSKFNMVSNVSAYQKNSIYSLYNFQDSNKSGAVYYGAGVDIFDSKKFNVTFSLSKNKIDEQKSETTAMIGLKMSFDLGSRNILGP